MWKEAYLESRIMSADPLELVSLLYQGAIDSVRDARKYLAQEDIPARGKAIAKATDILIELEASLNHKAGGSISRRLADMYRSEEHTSELQSLRHLVCRLLLEKKQIT